MAGERNGSLVHFVLTAGGSDDDEAAQLPVFGGHLRTEEEDPEYGFAAETQVCVLDPSGVQRAAAFLQEAPVSDLVKDLGSSLAREVAALSYSTPWSEEWAASLSADLQELKDFFAAAADVGDVMIKSNLPEPPAQNLVTRRISAVSSRPGRHLRPRPIRPAVM